MFGSQALHVACLLVATLSTPTKAHSAVLSKVGATCRGGCRSVVGPRVPRPAAGYPQGAPCGGRPTTQGTRKGYPYHTRIWWAASWYGTLRRGGGKKLLTYSCV